MSRLVQGKRNVEVLQKDFTWKMARKQSSARDKMGMGQVKNFRDQILHRGGFHHLEKYYSIGRIIPYILEKQKFIQTTNQVLVFKPYNAGAQYPNR